MNRFIDALRDGLSVLGENWQLVIIILALILVSQFFMYRVMKSIFGNRFAGEELYSLSMAGWLLPASIVSMLWYVFRIFMIPQLNAGIVVVLFGIVAVGPFFRVNRRIEERVSPPSMATLLCLLAILCISIPLRLAFISELVLPMYFDSTRHYMIIDNLLSSIEPSAAFSLLTTDYYHVGFHILTACIASILNADISQSMLVVGQMIVLVMPVGAFFLVKQITGSNSAGLFSVLLAGFGWSMPAYALNWGKYPAVTSLALIPFVLSIAYLAAQHRDELTQQKKSLLYIVLAGAIAVCGLLHSRSLIVIAIAALAWILAGWWQELPGRIRLVSFYSLLLGILFLAGFIYRQEVFEPLFNPYLRQGLYVTVMIVFLSIFAQKVYPKWTAANLAAIFLLLCALFISTLDLIARLEDQTLLDRPFVEILLYLPFSFLGGLGLAGLVETLKQARTSMVMRGEHIGILFMLFLIGHAILYYDFHPSECCSIVDRDDMKAMDWIRSNIPEDARILIAADELTLSPSSDPEGYAPADGGAWITSLTGRTTVPLMYDTNLDKDPKFESICKLGVDYIYIGGRGLSFYAPRIRSNPHWYKPVLSLSRVEVYQVVGCR